uniref:Poly [ADP-ribose] polymerase n=1 Tax=Amphimedon queenslandica TaxID=400682 RepID=A0A1X7UL11_AMPQE
MKKRRPGSTSTDKRKPGSPRQRNVSVQIRPKSITTKPSASLCAELPEQQYTIKVNHLPRGANERELLRCYNRFGVISSYKIIPATKESYALITYETESDAERAVRYTDGTTVIGSIVSVVCKWKDSTPTKEQYTLKVTNLSLHVTQKEMEHTCCSYSDYQSLKVNKGHAYVNFLSLRGAERAMESLRKVEFYGQCPKVNLKESSIQSQPHSDYKKTTSSIPHCRSVITHHHGSSPHTVSPQAQQVETSTVKVTLSGRGVTGEALEEYFSQFGDVLQTPAIIPGKPDYAYVKFESSEEAKAACIPNKVNFDGTLVSIKLSNKPSLPALIEKSSKLVTDEDDSLVNLITIRKFHKLEDHLSSIVTTKASKDGRGIHISGDKDKVDIAESIVRLYMKQLQDQIISKSMYLNCQFIPLLKNLEVFQAIQQHFDVEFKVILPNGSTKSIAAFSNTIASAMSSSSYPLTVESISEYLSGADAVSWSFFDDNQKFTLMSATDSAEIEKLYQEYLGPLSHHKLVHPHYSRRRWQYKYNFDKMVQINTTTKKQRKIKRVDPSSLCLSCRGLEDDVKTTIAGLNEILEEMVIKKSLTGCSIDIVEPITKLARSFCVKVDSSLDDKIIVSGCRDYLTKVFLVLEEKRDSLKFTPLLPSEWEPQTDNTELKRVTAKSSSSEWLKVVNAVKKTMKEAKIIKVQRIQNKYLYHKYALCKRRMHEKNGGEVNEKWLFHGSSEVSPEVIYESEHGFDFRYSGDSSLWGKGAYFAVNASYSGVSYAFRTPERYRQIFIAFVLTGNSIRMERDSTLFAPPKKKDGSLYDSVNGVTGSSRVYIVYDHDKSYPAYLITFQFQ